mmetsp:Transcript_56009/g.103630  ORF Transcript_56009/g.103630 Transcript_56009/m.103630 type:complete len:228 (-) Transcript_56009:7-690(-)
MSPDGKGWASPGVVQKVLAISVILYGLWRFVVLRHLDDPTEAKTLSGGAYAYNRARLSKYTGKVGSKDESSAMLLVIWGRVFNVTSGATFYAPGREYNMFPGHDCTKAMAIASTKRKHLDVDLDAVEEKHFNNLNDTYWHTYVRKYPIVGWYSDAPYDPSDFDQFAGPWANVSSEIAASIDAGPRSTPAYESKCPAKRVARAVKQAVSSLIPAGLLGYGSEQASSDL